MTSNTDAVPKKSGYAETHPRNKDGDERTPDKNAPRQPQNDPNAKPKPASGN